jgi:hypothetical protein
MSRRGHPKGTQFAVGAFVSVSYGGSWYPARIVRLDGDNVIARRTQKSGDVPQILVVGEDQVRVIAEKNFGNY